MTKRWQPSPTMKLSFALHAAAGAGALAAPSLWPLALAAVAANHVVLTTAGMLPRSTLLGPNINRLPGGAAARGEVALTIDDGPDPEVTPRVLDQLDAGNARATFFCIGSQAQRHPALVREIVARGHAIENHSMHHYHFFAALGPRRMRQEIIDAQHCLADLTGRAPIFFRPTAGLRSPLLDPVLSGLDLRLASWTRRAYDTQRGNPERAFRRLTQSLGAGDILLLHDGNAARTPAGQPLILEVLPQLMKTIEQLRLKPVTLDSAFSTACRP